MEIVVVDCRQGVSSWISTFEMDDVADGGTEVKFIAANETTGFGNRDSGRPLRATLPDG